MRKTTIVIRLLLVTSLGPGLGACGDDAETDRSGDEGTGGTDSAASGGARPGMGGAATGGTVGTGGETSGGAAPSGDGLGGPASESLSEADCASFCALVAAAACANDDPEDCVVSCAAFGQSDFSRCSSLYAAYVICANESGDELVCMNDFAVAASCASEGYALASCLGQQS